jgi:hypothetical protein
MVIDNALSVIRSVCASSSYGAMYPEGITLKVTLELLQAIRALRDSQHRRNTNHPFSNSEVLPNLLLHCGEFDEETFKAAFDPPPLMSRLFGSSQLDEVSKSYKLELLAASSMAEATVEDVGRLVSNSSRLRGYVDVVCRAVNRLSFSDVWKLLLEYDSNSVESQYLVHYTFSSHCT